MIRQVLRRLGLVTRGQLHAVEDKLRGARQRLAEAAAREAARRDEAKRHKARLTELESEHERRMARSREAASEAANRIAALEGRIASLEQKSTQRGLRAEAAAREDAALDARVTSAMQELARARGDLVAVEVKLDILEGAANALDARLRTAARPLPVSGDAGR